jgi:hypothetical protein
VVVKERALLGPKNELSRRQNEQPNREQLVRSSAFLQLEKFRDRDWRRDSQFHARRLRRWLGNRPEMRRLARGLDQLDWSNGYEVLHAGLRDLKLATVLVQLARADLNPGGTADQSESSNDLESARASAGYLSDQVANPRFQHCYPIIGSWGSGRTRLLIESGHQILERGDLIVFLGSDATGELSQQVLDQGSKFLAKPATTLAELSRELLNTLGSRLYVVLDDSDLLASERPNFFDTLRKLISESTVEPPIRWIIAADEAHLDVLVSRADQWFWEKYGYLDALPQLAGWVDLNSLDCTEQIGLRLIDQFAGTEERLALDEFRRDPLAFKYEVDQLCMPLPAWLSIETGFDDNGRRTLSDIHRGAIVVAYWNRRKAILARSFDGAEEELDQLVTILAQRFQDHRHVARLDELTQLVVRSTNMPSLRNEGRVDRGFSVLRAGGLVKFSFTGDPEVTLQQVEVEPKFELFWGYRIARLMLNAADRTPDSEESLFTELRTWALSSATNQRLGEAVVQFGLVLVQWDDSQRAFALAIWRRWIADSQLPIHPLLLAAVSAPSDIQSTLAAWLARSPVAVEYKRGRFALLRLIALSSTDQWPAHRRLELVRPQFSALQEEGLSSYFAYVVAAVVARDDLCDQQNYVATLRTLAGTEDAGIAPQAADAMALAGRRIFADDTTGWLKTLLQYLRRSTGPERAKEFPQRQLGKVASREEPVLENSAFFFWQWLLRATCRELIRWRGLVAFDALAKVGWYVARHDGVAPHVATRMQIEANVALGSLFPRDVQHEQVLARQYLEIVTKLMKGQAVKATPVEQREIAFYLIRHSTVTGREPGVVVHRLFRPVLAELCADRRLHARIGRWLEPMCEANSDA